MEENKRRLTFKKDDITLDQYGKALKAYNKLVRLFGGRNATTDEFADWLVSNGFVEESEVPEEEVNNG